MESLEEMKKRLASLQEQKRTAEQSSDLDYAKELAVEIAELEQQIASLPPADDPRAIGDAYLKNIRNTLGM